MEELNLALFDDVVGADDVADDAGDGYAVFAGNDATVLYGG